MAAVDAIRDVGDTLVYLLRSGIEPSIVERDRILLSTPDEFRTLQDPRRPAVTVFLYRVAVNPALRNAPRRTLADGRVTRPLLPLELGYLLTPWASQTRDEHRIAGRLLQVLNDCAELGPADLQGDSWEAGDSVQLALDPLPLGDHYRIWDTTGLPYRLSLTYLARVVGIEPRETLAPVPVLSARHGERVTP